MVLLRGCLCRRRVAVRCALDKVGSGSIFARHTTECGNGSEDAYSAVAPLLYAMGLEEADFG